MVGRLSGTLAGHWGRGVGLCNLSRLIAPAVPLAWVPGESAALATFRPWERREVAGALWAALGRLCQGHRPVEAAGLAVWR